MLDDLRIVLNMIIVILIALTISLVISMYQRESKCEQLGGKYVIDSGLCIKKESVIPLQ